MTVGSSTGWPRNLLGRGAANAAPRNVPDPPRRVLLASTGEPFSREVIARAIELATPGHAKITVLAIARVFGTSLGFPNPGLQPNRIEIEERKKITEDAARTLRAEGFDVRVAMSKARNMPKMIARWANAKNFHAIVVADPERPAWRRFVEGDLTHEIERRCAIPVHAVRVPAPSHRGARA